MAAPLPTPIVQDEQDFFVSGSVIGGGISSAGGFARPQGLPTPLAGRSSGHRRYTLRVFLSEPVYDLWSNRAGKAKVTNCKLVLSFRSQFFHHLRHFSNQANAGSSRLGLSSAGF